MSAGVPAWMRSPAALAGTLLFLIGLIILTVGATLWLNDSREQRRLDIEGSSTAGVVVDKSIHVDRTSGGQTDFNVAYRFTPRPGEEIADNARVDHAMWRRLETGDTIEIVYLPEAPSTHRVEGQRADLLLPILLTALGAGFGLPGAWLIWTAVRSRPARPAVSATSAPSANPLSRPARRRFVALAVSVAGSPLLLFGAIFLVVGVPFLFGGMHELVSRRAEDATFVEEGRPVQGMVLTRAIKTERRRSGSGSNARTTTTRHYRVTYRFATLDGHQVVGTSDIGRGAWDALQERGPIEITYLPRAPWLHRVAGEGGGWGFLVLLGIGLVGTSIGGFVLVQGVRKPRGWVRKAATKRRQAAEAQRSVAGAHAASMPAASPAQPDGGAVAASGRSRSRQPGGWIMPAVGGIFFVVGLALLVDGINRLVEERRYAATGLLADGHIVAKALDAAERDGNEATRYVAEYRFVTADGQTVAGEYELPVERWEVLREGDSVSVRYLPDQPRRNREASELGMAEAVTALVLAPVTAGVGVGLLYFVYRRRRARR